MPDTSPSPFLPDTAALTALRIWDLHFHLEPNIRRTLSQLMEELLPFIDRMGIERLCPFLHVGLGTSRSPAEFKPGYLKEVEELLRRWPDRLLGFVWLNANKVTESLAALDRWVKDGPMVGVKFGGGPIGSLRCNHPNFDPLIARAAELKAPVYIHTWMKVGGDPPRPGGDNNPGESSPQDVVDLAARHPGMELICGHAGGDWEIGIRTVRRFPLITLETAGNDPTAGFVEMAVRELGASRIVFGGHLPTRGYGNEMGKTLAADIPPDAKKQILGGNLRRLLTPILKAKGISL
ncbi:MAG: amidohydrolase family protein [Prosthecobacter sp.]|nr:amidohydrolase family protein [Prosthecobacter sp.]